MSRQSRHHILLLISASIVVLGLAAGGCGGESEKPAAAQKSKPSAPAKAPKPRPVAKPAVPPAPADLPNALVMGLAQFGPRKQGQTAPVPLPASLEFISRVDGQWIVSSLDDSESNVFHKAMAYRTVDGKVKLLSAGGTAAILKLWTEGENGPMAEKLWEKDFGGKFSRMRDIEVGDIYGDGKNTIAVATHDQGVVATVHPNDDGTYEVKELDVEADTFVHEVELGDMDGDGVLEVYATPSEPNRLDGSEQTGIIVSYVPAKGIGRTVVADLGTRHAKEIYLYDVDGDGKDELYTIVEGNIDKNTKRLVDPVEIRRYKAGDDPKGGGTKLVTIDDRLGRFLTVGDLDGDGKIEFVAALFKSGLWLLRPGDDPDDSWRKEQIDPDSGGFEHASIIADLDEDGRDELYVASDNDSEVRRYVWHDGKLRRESIYKRTNGNSVFTWNIMPVPLELVP